jgi:hypothetical protein
LGKEAGFDQLLAAIVLQRTERATVAQLEAHYKSLLSVVRDPPDAEIGVEIRCAEPRPHVFVSSNRKHWRPTEASKRALAGVEVMRPLTFLNFLSRRTREESL